MSQWAGIRNLHLCSPARRKRRRSGSGARRRPRTSTSGERSWDRRARSCRPAGPPRPPEERSTTAVAPRVIARPAPRGGRPAGRRTGLAGHRRGVGSYWPAATTLWDYVYLAMPFNQPGSLTTDEVYAAVAYVLFLNNLVGEDDRIDAAALPRIEMPNQDGFVPDPRPDIAPPAIGHALHIERLLDGPIITPDMDGRIGGKTSPGCLRPHAGLGRESARALLPVLRRPSGHLHPGVREGQF